ncbi:MAG: putative transport system ATP-binding protein [Actinomycetota bacterium]|jgi:putative ABC transport system ATP-binding protein|nr:putative transport system ATP-binding protein [Actinomycetota bacterium]
MTAVLTARRVVKSFGATPALRGVDLTVEPGETVAVLGPSGSGKSTLLHCLAGLTTPDAGEVQYDGTRLDLLSDADRSRLRRSEIGVVFQYGQLVPELTAAENVALPLVLARRGRSEAVAAARTWLDRVGVPSVADARPGELSAGQAQRVALARALVTEPRLLVADEPTGALDSLAAEQVMELIAAIAKASGTTIVLVTHDLRVASYADREVVLRDGQLAGSEVPA